MATSPIALNQTMHWAALALHSVAQGQATHQALAPVPQPMRPAVQALLFHALRHWGATQALVQALSTGRVKPRLKQLLCVALALLDRPEEGVRYDTHTVVNEAVRACQLEPQWRAAGGMVNACLRRYGREQVSLRATLQDGGAAAYNHPEWWLARIRAQYPQYWQRLVEADLQPAPMVLRVNRRHHEVAQYQQLLTSQGISSEPVGRDGLVLSHAVAVQRLPGFEQGWVSVQDASAQVAARLVWESPLLQQWRGEQPPRILDACAAPGGKTGHLLELGKAHVTALDVDATRLQRVRENLQRLRLEAQAVHANASQPGPWQSEGPWDAILLDAPCSASGIARRHPDVLWLRRETDIEQLALTQSALLDALWPQLRAGGRLVYATCSVFHEEGIAQVAAFVARTPDASWQASPGHWLPQRVVDAKELGLSHNAASAYDGFFYAILDKR